MTQFQRVTDGQTDGFTIANTERLSFVTQFRQCPTNCVAVGLRLCKWRRITAIFRAGLTALWLQRRATVHAPWSAISNKHSLEGDKHQVALTSHLTLSTILIHARRQALVQPPSHRFVQFCCITSLVGPCGLYRRGVFRISS